MDLHFFSHFIIIIIIIFYSFPVDFASHATSCVPQNCGNGPNISSPFWIPQQQPPSCGSPGFNITCENRNPIITISNQDYVVKDIFHNNYSFVLVMQDAFNESNICPTPLTNFSLHGTPFNYTDLSVDLFFFYNCSSRYEELTYAVDCASNGTSFSSFAIFHPEILETRNYSTDSCQSLVNAPVHVDSLNVMLYETYTDVLRKGFLLEWKCSHCEEQGTRINLLLKLVIGGVSALLSFVIMFIIFCIWKPPSRSCVASLKRKTTDDKNIEAFVMHYGSLTTNRYKYSDIKKMTDRFKDKLGQGGFGQVFKGKLSDGRLVAVKVLNSTKSNGQEFINEVASIGRTAHVNIVNLLGFCFENKKRALVYEYMQNGSLEKFIDSHAPLGTSEHIGVKTLYEIALGVACGLDYLHRGCNTRILHLDIKPHNILLDEDFCPKIADFGLAKLYSRKESIVSMLEARGTIGYIAPEVYNKNFGGVSHKSDVYSYGMLLLEMVGGRKNIDVGLGSGRTSEIYFPDWIYNRLHNDDFLLDSLTMIEENNYARKMTIVGLWCIQPDPNQRPSINEVTEMLEGSMEALKVPPKPFFSSPPRSPTTIYSTSESMIEMT